MYSVIHQYIGSDRSPGAQIIFHSRFVFGCIQVENSEKSKNLLFKEVGVCLTGDGASSLYTEVSRTETGLGCSGAMVASSASDTSSADLGADF